MILTEEKEEEYIDNHSFLVYVTIANSRFNERVFLGTSEIAELTFDEYLKFILNNVDCSKNIRLTLESCHDVVCWYNNHVLVVNPNNCNWKKLKEFLHDNYKKLKEHNVIIRASNPKENLIARWGEYHQAKVEKELKEQLKESFTITTKSTC